MIAYEVALVAKKEEARETWSFFFERPAGFTFRSGQFVELTLINPKETDAEGNTRSFSLANAPFEEELMITTRLRDSAFKKTLKDLPVGTKVRLEGPFGSFLLHQKKERPAVFLMGGIGITPVRSMILQALYEKDARQLILLYSNRKPEDSVFLEELNALALKHQNFIFVPTMTQIEKGEWSGERGYVDEEKLKRFVDFSKEPVFYSAGPAPMVAAMWQLLTRLGVSDDDIRREEFPGY